MDIKLIMKIKSDEKQHEFLINHSYYYKLLNRSPLYYKKFLDDYKKYKRENSYNKFNETLDNIELISNIVKIN